MDKMSSFWFVQGMLERFAEEGVGSKPGPVGVLNKVAARIDTHMGGSTQHNGRHRPGQRVDNNAAMSGLETERSFMEDSEPGRIEGLAKEQEAQRVQKILSGMKENGIEISEEEEESIMSRLATDEDTAEDSDGLPDLDEINEDNSDIRERLPFKSQSKPADNHLSNYQGAPIDTGDEM